MRKNNADRALA
jgi:hypothetical protein